MNRAGLIQKSLLCLGLFLFSTFSTSGAPKLKSIKIKHKGTCDVSYVGMVEKALPAGKGTLYISVDYTLYDFYHYSYKDIIEGEFDGFHVKNGTVHFNSGSVYCGDLDILIDVPNIEYHLLKGEVSTKSETKSMEINTCVVLKKPNTSNSENNLKLFPEVVTIEKYAVPSSFQNVKDFKIDDALISSFIGADFKLTADYRQEWAVNKNTLEESSPLEFNLSASNNLSGKVIYGDPNNWRKKMFCLSLSNGNTLYVCDEYGDHWDRTVDIIRNIDSARIEYHLAKEKDGAEWFRELFYHTRDDLFSWVYSNITSRKEGAIASGAEDYTTSTSFISYYGHCYTVTYFNGNRYQGSLYSTMPEEAPWVFISLIKQDITEDDFYFGEFTNSTGDRTIYLKGYPQKDLVDRKATEDAAYKERVRRENEEIERERAAMAAELLATRSEQARKYGKKYVDAIYDENRILVGTPESLLKEHYSIFINSETEKYIIYDIYYASTVRSYTVWVDKSTHRVTTVK